MNKLVLLFILLFSGNLVFAQVVKFTIVAGLNESTASQIPDTFAKGVAEPGETFPNSKLTGFHIGALAEFSHGLISIQSGLLYTTKGGIPYSGTVKISFADYLTRNDTLRLNYIQMPINVLYHLPVTFGKFFIGGGPYLGLGISGKASVYITDGITGNSRITHKSEKVTYGSGYNDIKNPDLGLGAKLGFILNNGILIGFNYDHGFTNLSNDPRFSGTNKVLGLSLGYCF